MKVSSLLYCSILFWSAAYGAEPECDLTIRDGNAAQDLDRVLRCFDQRLKTLENGNAKAHTKSSKSPDFLATNYIPGNYQSPDGKWNCTVDISNLSSERQEGSMSCKSKDDDWITLGWANGPLEGHPFETDLRKAGIDKISGAADYGWGNTGGRIGYPRIWGCFIGGELVSVRQAGSQINITDYGNDNTSDCSMALTIKK